MHNSEMPALEIRILNFVRSNPGYPIDKVSQAISVPLNHVHVAVANLKQKGLLANTPTLKIGNRIS